MISFGLYRPTNDLSTACYNRLTAFRQFDYSDHHTCIHEHTTIRNGFSQTHDDDTRCMLYGTCSHKRQPAYPRNITTIFAFALVLIAYRLKLTEPFLKGGKTDRTRGGRISCRYTHALTTSGSRRCADLMRASADLRTLPYQIGRNRVHRNRQSKRWESHRRCDDCHRKRSIRIEIMSENWRRRVSKINDSM